MPWIKKTETLNSQYQVLFICNDSPCQVTQLEMNMNPPTNHHRNNKIAITASFPNLTLLNHFVDSLPRHSGPPCGVSAKLLRASIETDHVQILKDFIVTLHTLQPFDGLMRKQIINLFTILMPTELDEMNVLIKEGKTEEAFALAAASNDEEIYSEAAQYYLTLNEVDRALAFYLHVPVDHPYYASALTQTYILVTQQLTACMQSKITLSSDQKLKYDMIKIATLFKISESQNYLQVFMAGLKFKAEIHHHTMLLHDLQLQIANLTERLSNAETTLAAIKMENAKLKNELKPPVKTNSNSFRFSNPGAS